MTILRRRWAKNHEKWDQTARTCAARMCRNGWLKKKLFNPHPTFFTSCIHKFFHFLCHFNVSLPSALSKLIFSSFSLFSGEFIDFFMYMCTHQAYNNSISWDDCHYDDDYVGKCYESVSLHFEVVLVLFINNKRK